MYKHTQIGWVILIALGVGAVVTGYFGLRDLNWQALIVFGILVVCVPLFSTLTVLIDGGLIDVRFGVGLIRKKFRVEEISSCRAVRNRLWYGFGIRKIPKGWLYNVSGLDAVELTMRNRKVYRIGTDEPQKLIEFIQMHICPNIKTGR